MAQRYESYKDSGVQWLGEIPSHWGCVKLKNIVSKIESGTSVNGSTSQHAKGNEFGVLKTGAVSFRVFNPLQNKLVEGTEIQLLSCPVTKNTIIVSRMNTPELVGSCAVVEEDYPNLFLPDRLWQVHFKDNVNIKYLHWILNGNYVRTRYAAICVGSSSTMQNISQGQFLETKITFPSLSEQNAIVTYLDGKCAKIEEWLSKKQKEVEHLQELKQRVVADAVMRGLNNDVAMKASVIPWLKEMPEHWEEKRLAALFTGDVDTNKDFLYQRAFKFNYGSLVPKNEIGDLEDYRDVYVKYSIVNTGDILVNGLNLNYDFISQRVACAPYDGIITSAYVVCRPRDNVNYDYYTYLFKAMDSMKLFHGMGTGIRLTLSFKELKKQMLPVPPREEQKQIVAHINKKTSKIDKLIANINKEIEAIKEYKQRLISDVVTGQIKVC